jgi:NADPH:quinone reductase-like Zn-dependent oxidoreductase
MPTPTRYWEFDRAGGPDVLRLMKGVCQEPGYGEVRLRVEAVSLNRSDLMFLRDGYIEKPRFPSRLGGEAAGVIEALGPGVNDLKVGDRVTSVNAFAKSEYGMFDETPLLPARAVLPVPDRFTSAEAASFGVAYTTNYFGLFEVGQLKPFQTVLVTAASSTIGLATLPMIRSAGAISIATTRTSKKRDALLRFGADHVIATDEENLVERVMEVTSGRGVDFAYDCAPATLGEKVVQSIKVRGIWIVYGFLTEPSVFPWWLFASRSLNFDLYTVYRFVGNPAIGLPGQEEKFRQGKRIIAAAIASGQSPAVPVDKEFKGLEQVPAALRYMASNEAIGKIVVSL